MLTEGSPANNGNSYKVSSVSSNACELKKITWDTSEKAVQLVSQEKESTKQNVAVARSTMTQQNDLRTVGSAECMLIKIVSRLSESWRKQLMTE